jgi:transposase
MSEPTPVTRRKPKKVLSNAEIRQVKQEFRKGTHYKDVAVLFDIAPSSAYRISRKVRKARKPVLGDDLGTLARKYAESQAATLTLKKALLEALDAQVE